MNIKAILIVIAAGAFAASAQAGSVCRWTGGAGDNKWSSSENWETAPKSGEGDELVFDTSSGAIVTENDITDIDIAKITISGDNDITINGERILIKSGADGSSAALINVLEIGTAKLVINAPMTIDKNYCQFYQSVDSAGRVTVNGDLEYLGVGTFRLRSARWRGAAAMEFNGDVTAANGFVNVFPNSGGGLPTVCFNGKVTAKEFGLSNYTGNWGGDVTIGDATASYSAIDTLHSAYGFLCLKDENVFSENGVLNVYHCEYGATNGTTICANQMVKRLVCSNRARIVQLLVADPTKKRSDSHVAGSGYPTLTVADDADEDISFYFDEELNLTWAPENANTLSITNIMPQFYSNTISGAISVNAGRIKACAGTTFKSLSKLVVLNAARFEVAENNANPFGDDTVALLDTDARLVLKSDCTFASVVASGQIIAAGTYTAAQLPSVIAEGSTGSLTVLTSSYSEPGRACWVSSDGEYSTAANWLSGQLPSSSVPGFIGCFPGAITSRISSATSVDGKVTVDGFAGGRPAVLETSTDVSFVDNELVLGPHGQLVVTAGTATTKDLTTEAGSEIILSGTGVLVSEKVNGDETAPSVLDATIRLAGYSTFTSAVSQSVTVESKTTYLRDLFGASLGNTLSMEVSGNARYVSRALSFGVGIKPKSAETGGMSRFTFAGQSSGSVGPYAYVGYYAGGNGELCIADQAVFSTDAGGMRYGLFAGSKSSDSTTPANGVVRVSGGRLLIVNNVSNQAPTGFGIGWGIDYDSGNTNCNVGTVYLSGGAITNSGPAAWTVIGAGAAKGSVYQTGGIFAAVPTANGYSNNTVIGFRGGNGRYEISGGRYYGTENVIVGGMAKADGPLPDLYTALSTDRKGVGVLKVTGGTFETAKDVLVSHGGDGTVEIGAGGLLKAANLRLESSTAKLAFAVGEGDTCGKIVLSGSLTAAEGATVEVDVSNLDGVDKISLVEAAELSGIDMQRVVITGDAKGNAAVRIRGGRLIVCRNNPFVVIFR